MFKSGKSKEYVQAFEIFGISPLPHYYEEIYTNLNGIKKLGLRGDRYYVFYSKDSAGCGFYEKTEMRKSAQSVYDYFSDRKDRQEDFIAKCQDVIKTLQEKVVEVEKLDPTSLSTQELIDLSTELNHMYGWCFSHYVVSQPYRLKLFEEQIERALSKRVARSRINEYFTELATSHKMTQLGKESIDWLKLIINFRHSHKLLDPREVSKNWEKHHDLSEAIHKHFDNYKILTLGDGSWSYDISFFTSRLESDLSRPLKELEASYKEQYEHPQVIRKRKKELIKQLYLEEKDVQVLEFLADVGHYRLLLRTDAWIPFIKIIIQTGEPLPGRLKLENPTDINFLTEEEIINSQSYKTDDLLKLIRGRRQTNDEFLMYNNNGNYETYFGDDAARMKEKLLDLTDHSVKTEVVGNTAMQGEVEAEGTVYNWGDDIQKAVKLIKKHPILVAGQTRPAMMPIIREAKGIITDEGGVTSHAAIVARELKIPTIINTHHGTKVFKTGDKILLDATNGKATKL